MADVTGNQGLVRTANRCAQIPCANLPFPPSVSKRPPPISRHDWTTPLFARHRMAPHMAQALTLRLSKRTKVGTSRQAGQRRANVQCAPQEYSHAAQGRSLPDNLPACLPTGLPSAKCHLRRSSASPELPRPARTSGHSGGERSGRAAISKLSGLSEARRSVPGLVASGHPRDAPTPTARMGKQPTPTDGVAAPAETGKGSVLRLHYDACALPPRLGQTKPQPQSLVLSGLVAAASYLS